MQGGEYLAVTGNQWYILYPCFNSSQPVIFSSATLFAQYNNEYVEIYDAATQEYLDCFTVKAFPGTPPTGAIINNNLAYDGTNCDPCYGSCVVISGLGNVSYIDSTGNQITTALPAKICTFTKPYINSTTTPIVTVLSSDCTEDSECEITCYKLTNCKTGQIIHSNNQSLFAAYAGAKIVSLNELDGCWTVELGDDCTCLEDVSVNITYENCVACLPIEAYVLTNCENESLQKFSEEDLSIYVGKIVSLDCGDCWYVDQIDYKPPQTQEFVVENVYESCEQCSRAYFILFDCEGSLEPITTFTDMTAYLGSTLKLAGYTGCWTVQTSPTPDYQNAIEVSVTTEFEDCDTCQTVTGCTCTKLKNISTVQATASYLDCAGVQQTITLDGGDVTAKTCVNRWLSKNPAYFETTEFGECVENTSTGIKECPAVLTGRMVRPGYTTPSCDPDKFERITCQTAEILYKQVLQLRYGISNCCPEDDDKTLVKKEVIDLQALNDPDYSCALSSSCCAPAQCGCGNCISQ